MTRHWSEDSYWTDAIARYHALRERGLKKLEIDLDSIDQSLFDSDGPAYRTLDAMVSVHEHEGMDGCRGAPRIVLALLQILSESDQKSRS